MMTDGEILFWLTKGRLMPEQVGEIAGLTKHAVLRRIVIASRGAQRARRIHRGRFDIRTRMIYLEAKDHGMLPGWPE